MTKIWFNPHKDAEPICPEHVIEITLILYDSVPTDFTLLEKIGSQMKYLEQINIFLDGNDMNIDHFHANDSAQALLRGIQSMGTLKKLKITLEKYNSGSSSAFKLW